MKNIKKRVTFIAFILAVLLSAPSIYAQDIEQQGTELTEKEQKALKKEKEKAEKERKKAEEKERKRLEKEQKKANKEPYNWEKQRPKLSGMESMDTYILYCDTMWNRIQEYRENISFFRLDTVRARNDEGEEIYVVKIQDEEGNSKNFGQSLIQGMDMAVTGSSIILDVALISILTTNAGLDLVANPLLTFTHSKCLKGGPQIIGLAYKEVKEIVNATKAQMADIKSMKSSKLEGSTDQAYLIPSDGSLPEDSEILDLASIDLGTGDPDDIDMEALDNLDLTPVETP